MRRFTPTTRVAARKSARVSDAVTIAAPPRHTPTGAPGGLPHHALAGALVFRRPRRPRPARGQQPHVDGASPLRARAARAAAAEIRPGAFCALHSAATPHEDPVTTTDADFSCAARRLWRWTNANVLLRRQRLSPPRHAPVGFAHGGRHAIPLPVPPVGCHTMPSPALSSSGARAAVELALLVDNSPTLRARAARAVATETPSAWRIARPRLPAPAQPTNSPCSWTTAPRRRRRPAKGPGRSRCRRRNSFGLAHCARAGLGGGPTRGPRDDHDLLRAPRRLSINFQFVGIAMSLVSRAATSCASSFLLSSVFISLIASPAVSFLSHLCCLEALPRVRLSAFVSSASRCCSSPRAAASGAP